VYDDADDQFYQGYPSQARRRPTILASVVTSIVTSVAVFFILRALDDRGYLGGRGAATAPAPTAAANATALAGASAVQVPNVVGVRLDQARELLKARNLLISIAEERDDPNRPAGSIVSQNPLAGSESQPGTTVQVAVARAVSSVIVPPLAGLKPDEAARLLASKGLQLGPQKAATSESVAVGLVAGSEPAAGSPVPPAGVVSLLIATPAGKAVPKVTGRSLTRGKKLLEEAGFKVGKTIYRYDPCCGEYIILRQTPAEGEAAAPGATVDLIVNEPG
jgi:beta-lactam-binding protein with PASTA domain